MQDRDLAAALRALGHPVRLTILRILAAQGQGQCCCADVADSLPLAQSTVSQHIKVLHQAGLIERRPRGTRNCYLVRTDRLEAIADAYGGLVTDIAPAPARDAEPA